MAGTPAMIREMTTGSWTIAETEVSGGEAGVETGTQIETGTEVGSGGGTTIEAVEGGSGTVEMRARTDRQGSRAIHMVAKVRNAYFTND